MNPDRLRAVVGGYGSSLSLPQVTVNSQKSQQSMKILTVEVLIGEQLITLLVSDNRSVEFVKNLVYQSLEQKEQLSVDEIALGFSSDDYILEMGLFAESHPLIRTAHSTCQIIRLSLILTSFSKKNLRLSVPTAKVYQDSTSLPSPHNPGSEPSKTNFPEELIHKRGKKKNRERRRSEFLLNSASDDWSDDDLAREILSTEDTNSLNKSGKRTVGLAASDGTHPIPETGSVGSENETSPSQERPRSGSITNFLRSRTGRSSSSENAGRNQSPLSISRTVTPTGGPSSTLSDSQKKTATEIDRSPKKQEEKKVHSESKPREGGPSESGMKRSSTVESNLTKHLAQKTSTDQTASVGRLPMSPRRANTEAITINPHSSRTSPRHSPRTSQESQTHQTKSQDNSTKRETNSTSVPEQKKDSKPKLGLNLAPLSSPQLAFLSPRGDQSNALFLKTEVLNKLQESRNTPLSGSLTSRLTLNTGSQILRSTSPTLNRGDSLTGTKESSFRAPPGFSDIAALGTKESTGSPLMRRQQTMLKPELLMEVRRVLRCQRIVKRWLWRRRFAIWAKKSSKLLKSFRVRKSIIEEIIETERTYIEHLETLVRIFIKPLEKIAHDAGNSMISEHEHLLLFGNLPLILEISKQIFTLLIKQSPAHQVVKEGENPSRHLLDCLPPVPMLSQIGAKGSVLKIGSVSSPGLPRKTDSPIIVSNSPPPSTIAGPTTQSTTSTNSLPDLSLGEVFIRMGPLMKLYSQYMKNYEVSIVTLKKLKEDEAFSLWLTSRYRDPACKFVDLTFYLIMPIQRPPRYQLLLKSLQEHTPPEEKDYLNVKQALDIISSVISETNARKHEDERLEGIQAKMINLPDDLIIVSIDRKFIHEGFLMIEIDQEKKKTKSFYFFLFNNLLLQTSPKRKSKYELKQHKRVQRVLVATSNNYNHGFDVILQGEDGELKYRFSAQSEAERTEWIKAFSSVNLMRNKSNPTRGALIQGSNDNQFEKAIA